MAKMTIEHWRCEQCDKEFPCTLQIRGGCDAPTICPVEGTPLEATWEREVEPGVYVEETL